MKFEFEFECFLKISIYEYSVKKGYKLTDDYDKQHDNKKEKHGAINLNKIKGLDGNFGDCQINRKYTTRNNMHWTHPFNPFYPYAICILCIQKWTEHPEPNIEPNSLVWDTFDINQMRTAPIQMNFH